MEKRLVYLNIPFLNNITVYYVVISQQVDDLQSSRAMKDEISSQISGLHAEIVLKANR